MRRPTHDDHCAQILHQITLLRAMLDGVDPNLPIPTCPGWTLNHLLRHLLGAQQWVDTVIRTRATGPVVPTALREVTGYRDEDPAALAAELVERATRTVEALREAGPDAPVWSPAPTMQRAAFWARRGAHEMLVHRADAATALGQPFSAAPENAADALDEWMARMARPLPPDQPAPPSPAPPSPATPDDRPAPLAPGRSVCLRATDTAPEVRAEWLVDLTTAPFTWTHAQAPATVTVRAPMTDLLLIAYGRRPPHGDAVEVRGDARLLTDWLTENTFN
ncbi:maleylpyruvate isomerase family mycothiol-dependent enzyme [Micromonospora sp. WMMD882]|uniref:maleylpyruvate isomerase family mycothiol-dependent enzyme n=1 Tax=Micromonospora sp. WMMD882 TaxID=3015151 RepID=UPI00248D2CCF|nr:maleylpyruvate isomerase family mycothiol-dependent enzyme [Micromonospora sp. WMMD882]WBB82086.1 maleylpyruvate isomerase family mycothiol-dependent enzyme [Micromonospora sp. WMMD882]